MERFINDAIHMTDMELFLEYWPLWIGVIAIVAIVMSWRNR